MSYKIKDLRNTDLNLYYFVSSGLSINGYSVLSDHAEAYVISGIYLIDGYQEDFENIKLPTIAIEQVLSRDEPSQIGKGKYRKYNYELSILMRTDGERDDLSEMVFNFFDKKTMTIYDYNLVMSSGIYQSIGTATFDDLTITKEYPGEQNTLKHMSKVNLSCSFATESGSLL